MNKVLAIGRFTNDPNIRYSQGDNAIAIADFILAVDRKFKKDGEPTADFIRCKAFSKTAEFIEKYCRKGIKMAVEGRIQTGSYNKEDGTTVYTTDVIVESIEFAESKNTDNNDRATAPSKNVGDGFMNIPDGLDDELPFN